MTICQLCLRLSNSPLSRLQLICPAAFAAAANSILFALSLSLLANEAFASCRWFCACAISQALFVRRGTKLTRSVQQWLLYSSEIRLAIPSYLILAFSFVTHAIVGMVRSSRSTLHVVRSTHGECVLYWFISTCTAFSRETQGCMGGLLLLHDIPSGRKRRFQTFLGVSLAT